MVPPYHFLVHLSLLELLLYARLLTLPSGSCTTPSSQSVQPFQDIVSIGSVMEYWVCCRRKQGIRQHPANHAISYFLGADTRHELVAVVSIERLSGHRRRSGTTHGLSRLLSCIDDCDERGVAPGEAEKVEMRFVGAFSC
jgi:hypothetical protein